MSTNKEAGDAAFQSNNWPEAIAKYSAAVNDDDDKSFLKRVFSNRSAVYCKLKNYSAALLDGEKCTELDSEWPKGYVRKGDALFGLKRWTDAANAYNRAESIQPGQGYESKAQLCVDARANEEARTRYAQQQQYAQAGAGMGQTAPQIPTSGWMAGAYGAAEKGLFILFLAYLLPLSWIPFVGGMFPHSTVIYRCMLLCGATLNALNILITTGRPQFSQDYLGRVLKIQGAHCLFLCIILFAAQPYALAALAMILSHVVVRFPMFVAYITPYLSQARHTLPPSMESYGPQLEQFIQVMSTSNGQQQLKGALIGASCSAEVLQGVALVFGLIFPTRNMLFMYMWWQYLLMRYMMDQSGSMKTAFTTLDGQISGLTGHSMCPAVVGKVYGMVRGYMISQVDSMRSQAEGREGAPTGFMNSVKSKLSSCTIS